ncbi:MAG: hypothetical protein HEEMFOPI_01390 [Holosporales bacterium]
MFSFIQTIHHFFKAKLATKSVPFLNTQDLMYKEVYTDMWPGNATFGENFLCGRFEFSGKIYNFNELMNILGCSDLQDTQTLLHVHSFEWLRDLRCMSDNASRRLARQLIDQWIHHNSTWSTQLGASAAYDPHLMGLRLSNWISCFDFFGASADENFIQDFTKSLSLQYSILLSAYKTLTDPFRKSVALKGLILACAALQKKDLAKLLQLYEQAILHQLYPDGGHISRDPVVHLFILKELIDIRTLVRQNALEEPAFLQTTIQKMVPILRLFRHGDGKLSDFSTLKRRLIPMRENPSQAFIDMILSLADVKGRPPLKAPDMGFERLQTKSGQVLINTKPHFEKMDRFFGPGTGVLNFEWSLGKNRHIKMADVVMQTSPNQWLQLSGAKETPQVMKIDRHVKDGQCLFEGDFESVISLQKNNPQKSVIFNHQRSIYLGAEKGDLRGSDRFLLTHDALCALRFVFNADVDISLLQSQEHLGALIKIPDLEKSAKKKYQIWRFISKDADDISIQKDSITNETAILLIKRLKTDAPYVLKWAFHQHL